MEVGMKILSFDQASVVTGWALFDNKTYIESGVIKKNKSTPITERVPSMALAICAKVKEIKPDAVIIEDIQSQSSVKTVIDLARLQGGIIMYCASKGIPIEIYHPSTWRKTLGFVQGARVKRDELKKQATEYIKALGFNIASEDESEAVCINLAAQHMI
jgi:Holliday junction resolvasome RuvABC endonuclease subunit